MDSHPLTVEEFGTIFEALLEAKGKRDPNGILCQLYWDALSPSELTNAEMWDAAIALIANAECRWPAADEIKQVIWDKRKRLAQVAELETRRQLTAAKFGNAAPTHQQIRQTQVALMAGIYKQQGDTPFYRNMLRGRAGIWQLIGLSNIELQQGQAIAITHAEVCRHLGIEADEEVLSA